jgi:hypothetical protein
MLKALSVVLVALATLSTAAYAGYTYSPAVTIDTLYRRATGTLGSARNSANAIEYIGCYTTSYSTGGTSAVCVAVNSANYSVSCSTWQADIVKAAQSIDTDSYISFTYDSSANCTSLQVVNYSMYEPKR